MSLKQIPIVAVVGPTASGKTGLGIELALRLRGEVISADSMQIYQDMAIATARPTAAEMRGVPHHLIGFLPPQEEYSVARFLEDASRCVAALQKRGRLPILVGGTGLYLSSLLDGIALSDDPRDPLLRQMLQQRAAAEGAVETHRRLAAIDPVYASTLHPNNLGRVLRALELYEATGITMSEQLESSRKNPSPYAPVLIGLDYTDREILYERINQRVDRMIQDGLVEEARAFYRNHLGKTSVQAIGFKELKPFLNGEESLESCTERLKRETRRYAKRQRTWFRRDDRVHWLMRDQFDSGQAVADAACGILESVGFTAQQGRGTDE